jgi:hypothetical protein
MYVKRNACKNMPSIKYMGYSVREYQDNSLFSYHIWRPFNDVIKECRPIKPGTKGRFPFKNLEKSKTNWDGNGLQTLLFMNNTIIKNDDLEFRLSSNIRNKFKEL